MRKFRSVGNGSRASQNSDTPLSDKESNEAVTPDVTDDRFSITFHSYHESFFPGQEDNIEHEIYALEANAPAAREALS